MCRRSFWKTSALAFGKADADSVVPTHNRISHAPFLREAPPWVKNKKKKPTSPVHVYLRILVVVQTPGIIYNDPWKILRVQWPESRRRLLTCTKPIRIRTYVCIYSAKITLFPFFSPFFVYDNPYVGAYRFCGPRRRLPGRGPRRGAVSLRHLRRLTHLPAGGGFRGEKRVRHVKGSREQNPTVRKKASNNRRQCDHTCAEYYRRFRTTIPPRPANTGRDTIL